MDFFEALWRDITSVFGKRVQLGTNSITTLNIIVWSLFIGFIIAIIATLYSKLVGGKVVRLLIEKKAHTPESALCPNEIGANKLFTRLALRRSSSLRRVVKTTLDTDTKQAKCSAEGIKYYIPNECLRKAEIVYSKPETSPFRVVLAIIAFVVLAMLAFLYIPDITQLISNVFGLV